MHIDSVIEDNYHRIKDDISMTLQSQVIVVEGGAEEVSTDAGQPQVHEEDEEQCTGPAFSGFSKDLFAVLFLI